MWLLVVNPIIDHHKAIISGWFLLLWQYPHRTQHAQLTGGGPDRVDRRCGPEESEMRRGLQCLALQSAAAAGCFEGLEGQSGGGANRLEPLGLEETGGRSSYRNVADL